MLRTMRWLYTILLYLLTPLILLRLLWRGLELRDYWYRWDERFGFVGVPATPAAIWVHAVSVGESLAALPLIRRLIQQHGKGRVLVTTMTPTGSARIRAVLGDEVLHTYLPYDLPGAVARFLERMQPQQVVVMETELWPNLFRALARRGIPLVIANARLSPRSFRGYLRVRGFAASTLADCGHVAAQSDADAERFLRLGAPAGRVSVMGNIKFDMTLPEALIAQGRALRDGAPVWVAASTHEGEEDAVLIAHRQILKTLPRARLIIVPRHPQRFDAVSKLIERSGLSYARRSTSPQTAQAQVWLGDSMGEMFLYFAASDLAFVGGSLVPVGGHNVLEPAALGLPVVFGPHMHNFVAARELLLQEQAAMEIADAGQLASSVTELLSHAGRARAMGDAGRKAIAANRGALERLTKILEREKAVTRP